MDERHIASVVVTEDSYSKHDPSRLTSMFVKPEESSTDPLDPKYVASVYVTENSVGYESINRNLTTDHQYAQIGENERDKSNHQRDQSKERPLKEKRNIREKKHKTVKTRTLVVSVIIAVIIGVLIGVFGVLAVQYFSNDKGTVDLTTTVPSIPKTVPSTRQQVPEMTSQQLTPGEPPVTDHSTQPQPPITTTTGQPQPSTTGKSKTAAPSATESATFSQTTQ